MMSPQWKSSYDMGERYIEHQAAVYSALTEKALKKNKDIATLSDQDVKVVEQVLEVLNPLKTVTKIMSTKPTPSVSMILPLQTTFLKSMEPKEEDSPIVREVKSAIRENLMDRYSDPALQNFLHKCTALDPRFKALLHVDNACRERIYNSLSTEIVAIEEQVLCLFYSVVIFFCIKCPHCFILNTLFRRISSSCQVVSHGPTVW